MKFMTAKEMFRELGYEVIQDDLGLVIYAKSFMVESELRPCDEYKAEVLFNDRTKSYHTGLLLVKKDGGTERLVSQIYPELHKAINKQIEELEW